MDDDKAIVLVPEARLGALTVEPEHMIERATAIARPLGKMILDRKLYTEIQGKKFVRVEGWSTLGAMLGVLPREVETKKLEDGYEATVELIRASDGLVIGRASAICLKSERRWGKADEYAIRSMAITRATGKAFRLGFSWVIKLAGDYEPTPAEEMDFARDDVLEGQIVEPLTVPQPVKGPDKGVPQLWPPARVQEIKVWLVDAGLIPPDSHEKHVLQLLDLTPFGPAVTKEHLVDWTRLYRGHRDEGEKPSEAAEKAGHDYSAGIIAKGKKAAADIFGKE